MGSEGGGAEAAVTRPVGRSLRLGPVGRAPEGRRRGAEVWWLSP